MVGQEGETGMSSPSMTDTIRREMGFAATATAMVAAIWLTGWLAPLNRSAGDTLLRLTHRNPPDIPVVAVVIDDRSVSAIGPLPWPRSVVAKVVATAHHNGAAAVVLDLLLADAGDAASDRLLGEALAQGPSLLAAALDPDGRWLLPGAGFGGASHAAHVHAEVGPDGVVRTIAMTKQADGLSLPALSLAAARVLRDEILIEPGAVIRPDFRPAPGRLLQIPAVDFLTAAQHQPAVAGRLVFIGVTATGSGDRYVVPTQPGPAPSPGVLVHASITASILRDGLIHQTGFGLSLFGIFMAALAPQVLRTRNGSFRLWSAAAVITVIVLGSVIAMEIVHALVPTPALVVAMIISILLREGFESRIARRERELEHKRRDMQRLVSHELKTPLASIAGFGEVLQRYELAPDEQRRVATLIRGESVRLGEMVSTFLDLERLGSGQSATITETVDLGAMVKNRLEILTEATRARGQHINPTIECEVNIQASPDLLARVVDNLVNNALKYSPEDATVDVSVTRDRGSAVLTVTDRGLGIPEQALPKLFERFYRVPGVEGPGSGLGLAVADEVVTWHGGCIEVESTVGQGSTFTVRLPVEA